MRLHSPRKAVLNLKRCKLALEVVHDVVKDFDYGGDRIVLGADFVGEFVEGFAKLLECGDRPFVETLVVGHDHVLASLSNICLPPSGVKTCPGKCDFTPVTEKVKGLKRGAFYKVLFFVPLTFGVEGVSFIYQGRSVVRKDFLTTLFRLDLLVHC